MKKPRILLWDIETTNLTATFGVILCIGYKWRGESKPKIITILDDEHRDMLDDKRLVKRFAEIFEQADWHVTWFGIGFDLKMLNSKLIQHGLKPLPPKPHIDLWKTARSKFKLHSNRLAVWEEFLGTSQKKTPITFEAWRRAALGDRKALRQVKEHCEIDVQVLEEVYERMKPWVDEEPRLQLVSAASDSACPSCGDLNITKRGYKVAATRIYQQYVCRVCGKWFRSKKAAKVGEWV